MLEPSKATATGAGRPTNKVVRVSLPADVGNDLAKFQRVQKDILGKLGCMACCSGWDIRWDIFNDFIVDKNLSVKAGQGF